MNKYIWWIFFVLIFIVVTASVIKSMYWPVAAYDSVTGYDLMAKVIAEEGRFVNSLFENGKPIEGSKLRLVQAPLMPVLFSFAHLLGISSKTIMSLLFLGFVLFFYFILKKLVDRNIAIVILFFIIITPDFYAFTSISNLNIPAAFFFSIGTGFLLIYLKKSQVYPEFFIYGIIGIILSSLCRTEMIIFIFVWMFYFLISKKEEKFLHTGYLIAALIPSLLWMRFINVVYDIPSMIRTEIFFDVDRIHKIIGTTTSMVFNTDLYGITFYIFILVVFISLFNKNHNIVFLLLIIVMWVVHLGIYYQIDNNAFDNLRGMLNASFKRGVFTFIPIIWMYIATNEITKKMFEKLGILYETKSHNQ